MLRYAFLATAMAMFIAPAQSADTDFSGNWFLAYSSRPGSESNLAIVKVEMKDGKPVPTAVFPAGLVVTGFEITDGKQVKFTTSIGPSFEGVLAKDGNVVGSLGDDRLMFRARLIKTEKSEIAANERITAVPLPEPYTKAQSLTNAALIAKGSAGREKDEEKKKELLEKAEVAQKEANEKVPQLFRDVIAKHADSPFVIEAAAELFRNKLANVKEDEANAIVALVEKAAMPYGERYATVAKLQTLEALATIRGLEDSTVLAADKLKKSLSATAPVALQSRVLTVLQTALRGTNSPKNDEALKAVTAELAGIESKLDEEYNAKVPPFKPTPFAGRKDKEANKVAVLELFTGAQCPPCVAADVAFDALQKAYKPSELVLIQYHLHIPGPDPLTNTDAIARARYYAANSTPSTFFNGAKAAAGGGGMAGAENKYKQYIGVIDPLLETSTEVKIAGRAARSGDKVNIGVEVTGPTEGLTLRLLVVEETVKYVGGNNLRFHHQVVRAMPGGADGVAISDKTFKHAATVELGEVRKSLNKYLDEYSATRTFPKPDRPMDMKALRVIALVQNDKTKEIVQAAQFNIADSTDGE